MSYRSFVLSFHDLHLPGERRATIDGGLSTDFRWFQQMIAHYRKEGYAFVSAPDFLRDYRTRPVILLTFDDGYKSLRTLLLDYAVREKVPVELFIISDGLESGRDPFPVWLFYWRDIADAVPDSRWREIESLEPVQCLLRHKGADHLRPLFDQPVSTLYHDFYQSVPYTELDRFSRRLTEMGVLTPTLLTGEEITEMHATGLVGIGAHSKTHRCFFDISAAEQEAEVNGSIEALSRRLDVPASKLTFAYPYGAYTPTAVKIVKERCLAGFMSGNYSPTAFDPAWLLPRISGEVGSIDAIEACRSLRQNVRRALRERARRRLRAALRRLRPSPSEVINRG